MLSFMMCICLSSCSDQQRVSEVKGDVLLVIDMQNAYTDEGPWTCPDMDQATENILELMKSDTFGQIIFTMFIATDEPVGKWIDYNEINREVNENAEMNRLIPLLEPYSEQYPVYTKSAYSSMDIKEVKDAVEACMKRGDSLVLTGVVSECCVLATAFDAIDMGAHVIYIRDACAGVNDETEEDVMDILHGLDYVHTAVMSTEEYLDSVN